jgi:protease-4
VSTHTTTRRPFTPEESALWEESAQYAYRSFRDKAAASRGMSIDDMQVRP